MKKSVVACAAGAVVLAAAAGAGRFAVLPAVDQVPSDLKTAVHYSGTATALDKKALAGGDVAHAVHRDLPIDATRTVEVTAVAAGAARLDDHTVVTAPGGTKLTDGTHLWAVDRKTLLDAKGPAGWKAEDHQGLVAGFPLHPKAEDYAFWDTLTGTAVKAVCRGRTSFAGRSAYKFLIESSGAPNAKTAAALPPALPTPLVRGLAGTLPEPGRNGLTGKLKSAGAAVPLTYKATGTATAWVDTETGVVLGQSVHQAVVGQVAGTDGPVDLLPVTDIRMSMTKASTAEAVDRAESAARGRLLVGTVAPAVALLLALGLALGAVLLGRRRRSDAGPAGGEPAGPSEPSEATESAEATASTEQAESAEPAASGDSPTAGRS